MNKIIRVTEIVEQAANEAESGQFGGAYQVIAAFLQQGRPELYGRFFDADEPLIDPEAEAQLMRTESGRGQLRVSYALQRVAKFIKEKPIDAREASR
jgi:hypothetical protein